MTVARGRPLAPYRRPLPPPAACARRPPDARGRGRRARRWTDRPDGWERGRRDTSVALDVDLALVGGGGAASLVLAALDRHGVRDLRVAVVDPVTGAARTGPGRSGTVPAATWTRCWPRAGTRSRWRRPTAAASSIWPPCGTPCCAPARSTPGLPRPSGGWACDRIVAPVDALHDDGGHVTVRVGGGSAVRASWALDSRPGRPATRAHQLAPALPGLVAGVRRAGFDRPGPS